MSSDDSDVGDLLEDLLANDDTSENEVPKKVDTLKELDFNFLERTDNVNSEINQSSKDENYSEIHKGDTDSSDDEDKRSFEEQKYTSSGRDIKSLLKDEFHKKDRGRDPLREAATRTFDFNQTSTTRKNVPPPCSTSSDVYADPFFKLRIVKPLVSSTELKERMTGRTPVTISNVKYHVLTNDLNNDWVTAGVLISKTPTRTSQKGNQYCIWKISDLSDSMNAISLFLFGSAYKSFWKTSTGTVVGVLNPNVLDNKDSKDCMNMSVDNAQKIMLLGMSKDMGTCKSLKKNGDQCTAIVNISRCEYCIYHVKREYNKFSRRAELQSSSTGGKGVSSLDALRNKVLGKGVTIYGGQAFSAVPAKRNQKLYEKDTARLALLKGTTTFSQRDKVELKPSGEAMTRKASMVELTTNQVKKDMERLNKLRGWSDNKGITLKEPSTGTTVSSPINTSRSLEKKNKCSTTLSTPRLGVGVDNGTVDFSKPIPKRSIDVADANVSKEQSRKVIVESPNASQINASSRDSEKRSSSLSMLSLSSSVPRLGVGFNSNVIDFSEPITKKHITAAKMNALKWVEQKGGIQRSNPNKVRLSKEEKLEKGVKRRREVEDTEEQKNKKPNATQDKLKEMIEVKSSHVDLIEQSHEEEKEKYFNKLEMKEKMEEKMMTTYKVDCKAVTCLICKYTAFSSSDLCKEQKHPLRVIDAVKRFFKCSDCGNRTISLDRIPSYSCKKCSSSSWARAAMMDEKRTEITATSLCIRGGEEKFIGSTIGDADLNMLVPEAD